MEKLSDLDRIPTAPEIAMSDQLDQLTGKLERLLNRCKDLKLRNAALEEIQTSLIEERQISPVKD